MHESRRRGEICPKHEAEKQKKGERLGNGTLTVSLIILDEVNKESTQGTRPQAPEESFS